MPDKLWELQSLTGDAIDCVKRALEMTSSFLTDQHSGEPLPWVEMGETQNRLAKALEALEVALQPIQAAIEAESEEDEYYGGMADGRSL